jgi:hypothetical protein
MSTPAQLARCVCDHRCDLVRLGHVGSAVGRADFVSRLELRKQRVDHRFVAESIQHDVRTDARKRVCDPEADAARRARHERDFGGEFHHQRALLERFITRRSVGLALWRVVTEASQFGWDFGGETCRRGRSETREVFGEITVQVDLLLDAPQLITTCHSRGTRARLRAAPDDSGPSPWRRRATPKS